MDTSGRICAPSQHLKRTTKCLLKVQTKDGVRDCGGDHLAGDQGLLPPESLLTLMTQNVLPKHYTLPSQTRRYYCRTCARSRHVPPLRRTRAEASCVLGLRSKGQDLSQQVRAIDITRVSDSSWLNVFRLTNRLTDSSWLNVFRLTNRQTDRRLCNTMFTRSGTQLRQI